MMMIHQQKCLHENEVNPRTDCLCSKNDQGSRPFQNVGSPLIRHPNLKNILRNRPLQSEDSKLIHRQMMTIHQHENEDLLRTVPQILEHDQVSRRFQNVDGPLIHHSNLKNHLRNLPLQNEHSKLIHRPMATIHQHENEDLLPIAPLILEHDRRSKPFQNVGSPLIRHPNLKNHLRNLPLQSEDSKLIHRQMTMIHPRKHPHENAVNPLSHSLYRKTAHRIRRFQNVANPVIQLPNQKNDLRNGLHNEKHFPQLHLRSILIPHHLNQCHHPLNSLPKPPHRVKKSGM
jgi:hypothetical protein